MTDVIDAGLKQDTTHTITYFVYDENYVNHRIYKEGMIYKYQPTCLGFFHRHPGSFDRFSVPDEKTMKEHCRMSKHGIISMLVNIDPYMRFTFYFASKMNELFNIPYEVGNVHIPKEFLEVATYEMLTKRFHTNVHLKSGDVQTETNPKNNNRMVASRSNSEMYGLAERKNSNVRKKENFEVPLMVTDRKLLDRIEKWNQIDICKK